MASSKINIILNAKNKASGPIKQVSGDLKGMEGATGLAGKAMIGLAAGAIAAAVVKLGQLSIQIQSTASQFNMIEAGGQRLAVSLGANFESMLRGMRAASGGMISDSELILAANKAMMLGVADNTEEMTALMNIAGERGQAMGLSMSQAFNDIVTGLGRGSAMILDNLGIIIDAEDANQRYAESIGKVSSELTDLEKKQALINAVLAQSSGDVELMIDPTQQLDASWQNFKTSIATFITEATPLPQLLSDTASGVSALSEAISEMGKDSAAGNRKTILISEQDIQRAIDGVKMLMAQQEEYGNTTSNEYKELQGQLNALTREQMSLAGSFETYYDAAAQIAMNAKTEQQTLQSEISITSDMLNKLIGKSAAAKSSVISGLMGGATGASGGDIMGGYNLALTTASDLQAQLGRIALETNLTYEEAAQYLLPQMVSQQNALWSEANKTVSAVSQVNEEYNKLVSTVSGVLSGALNVDVGVKASDFLPREDDINENARRLADIMVNGLTGQDWMSQFKASVPDLYQALTESGDPKTAAATMLREFEQGLRPELIDKEAAKERVRSMLIGDANMAELAQEIAQELAEEMGGSASGIQSIVNRSLGISDLTDTEGKAAGGMFGQGAVSGIGESGTSMVATLSAQLKLESNVALVREAGNTYGSQWGNGFLATVSGSVPPALIDLLVKLVLPGVQSGIQTQDTLEGAQ